MAMDKYSQDDDTLLLNLRNEEADLMQKVSHYLCIPEKTASENLEYEHAHTRLLRIREKITEIDLKKTQGN